MSNSYEINSNTLNWYRGTEVRLILPVISLIAAITPIIFFNDPTNCHQQGAQIACLVVSFSSMFFSLLLSSQNESKARKYILVDMGASRISLVAMGFAVITCEELRRCYNP